jgi:hypothetical protein
MKTELLEMLKKMIPNRNRCEKCKDAIDSIIHNINRGNEISITLTPDRNCDGNITHWHIGLR